MGRKQHILARRQIVVIVSGFLLIVFLPGLAVFGAFASLDATFSAWDLSKCILDELSTYEILGYEMKLNPRHVAEFALSFWVFPSAVFAGFANLNTYGLGRWTTRLRKHPHAQRLLSSLWMEESELTDYYLLIHRGFRSRQRRAYWRGR